MICSVHKQQITHFCTNKICNTLGMCPQCRIIHRNKFIKNSHNTDQVSKLQIIQQCRSKLQNDLNNLQQIYSKYENQYKAYQQIEESRRLLEDNKKKIISEINQVFQSLRMKLQSMNQSSYLQNKGNKEIINKGVNSKNQLEYLLKNLNSQNNIRKAMSFQSQRIYKQLKDHSLNQVASYWVYQNTKFTHQITTPKLKKITISEKNSTYSIKPFHNDSPLHFLITDPDPIDTDIYVHFFDTSENQLKIYNIKDKNWLQFKADQQLYPFGQTVYDPNTKKFIYFGGSQPGKRKSKRVIAYDYKKQVWQRLPDMIKGRSSFSCTLIKSNAVEKNKHLILIAGGMDQNNQIIGDCEIYDPSNYRNQSEQIQPLNFPVACATLCSYNYNIIFKFGGLSNNQNHQAVCQIIQKYDRQLKNWVVINSEILIGKFPSQYRLHYANSCSALINPNQIFVFGGYGYGYDHNGTKESYIFKIQETKKNGKSTFKYTIRFVNEKPLPFGQGFTRTKPMIYQKSLYVLQNISEGEDIIQSERNLLQFDGFNWNFLQKTFN